MNRASVTRERSVALLIAGLLLFNPPLLLVFAGDSSLFGAPLSFLYLFAAWAGVILLVAVIARRSAPPGEADPQSRQQAANDPGQAGG